MNVVGSAVEEAIKSSNKVSERFNYVGQFDRLNRTVKDLKGVGAMADSIKKMSVAPTLPTFVKEAAIQRGNSTHESLFGVAFFMQLRHLDHSLCDVIAFNQWKDAFIFKHVIDKLAALFRLGHHAKLFGHVDG